MAKNTLNRDQIINEISHELNFPKAKVKKIIIAFETELVDELKKSGKARLDHFGLFYLLQRKSRVIKQIRTKNPRLLLSQKTIRFRAGQEVKNKLSGKKPVESKARVASRPKQKITEDQDYPIEIKKIASKPKENINVNKPLKKINLAPVKIHSRADHEKVRSAIIERFLRLAREQKKNEIAPEIREPLEISPEGKLFGAIFKTVKKNGSGKLSLSLDQSDRVAIFQLSPRKKIADLPKPTVKKFLENHLDFHVFDIPQERFVKIAPYSKIKSKLTIHAYSIPTAGGASFNIIID